MSPVVTTITPRPATKLGDVSAFPFGAVNRPDSDLIGGYYKESGRAHICVSQTYLESFKELNIGFEPWKIGLWVSRRPKRPPETTRVVSTRFGYRVEHHTHNDGWRILGDTLADVPMLFPTVQDAILVTEAKLRRLPEAGVFDWLHHSCGYRNTIHRS
jgi:hypothetical protein